LGCKVVELFCDVDGTFPNHHPDPSKPENLAEMIASVKHYKADLGIAFDGMEIVWGLLIQMAKFICRNRQMMLFAKDVLQADPALRSFMNVKCTRHLANQIYKYGGKPVMWKTDIHL